MTDEQGLPFSLYPPTLRQCLIRLLPGTIVAAQARGEIDKAIKHTHALVCLMEIEEEFQIEEIWK